MGKLRRRRLQFTVRAWLVIVILATVPLAFYGGRIERWWRTPKPVARQTFSLYLLVTPRIVILEEDEEKLGIDLGEPESLREVPLIREIPSTRRRRL